MRIIVLFLLLAVLFGFISFLFVGLFALIIGTIDYLFSTCLLYPFD